MKCLSIDWRAFSTWVRVIWGLGWMVLLAVSHAQVGRDEVSPALPSPAVSTATETAPAPRLRFEPDGLGGFFFDTGLLRGRLHAGGSSLGVTEAYHVPTGARLDRGNGLLSHYRVFANGRRFGDGAWDWPSVAELLPDGRVEVRWLEAGERPFQLRARYQLTRPGILTVETLVQARETLRGLEVFLASYFDPAFTNSFVLVKGRERDGYANATIDKGEWQMYPHDAAARALAEDGRWRLEPHPVHWTFPAELAGPTIRAFRRALGKGILATFSAEAAECFAVATPHQTEPHFSTYLSLFGRTLAAGETARARVALIITGPATVAAP